MKKLLFPLLILILTFTAKSAGAQTIPLSNPIYIAALLLDEPSNADMAKLCEYYGYVPAAPEEDGFTVYTRSDSTSLRFRVTGDRYNTDPVVEVITDEPAKSIRKTLKELGYAPESKNSKTFTKGTRLAHRFSIATFTGTNTQTTLRFTKRHTRR